MATKRTTHRSSAGKKLYAVRDKTGSFKDIQTYKKAHGSDVFRRSKAEAEKRGGLVWMRRKRDPEVTAFMKTFRGFITSHFGKRCSTIENGCGCCQMWKAYDLVDTMIV
jgi:hypothetical protein